MFLCDRASWEEGLEPEFLEKVNEGFALVLPGVVVGHSDSALEHVVPIKICA
jgi:hypothetical protein